ncbi:centrosomal protein of 152 kDa [Anguilla rostrata]|uniref:centrosomal protein of 152 kDa n=1 Tax=Anguilla rostrata TaxID=7938 RepID=UPI0030D58A93
MSIDFDSVALQAQQEEEEEDYDAEDYAREQELHRLLTDLPDDMLEDSRDCSSPELEYSTCRDRNADHRTPLQWEQQPNWTDQQGVSAADDNYENGYDQEAYPYEDGVENFNGHAHLHHHAGQEYMNGHGGYAYPSLGTEESAISKDFSPEEERQHDVYPPQSGHHGEEYQHEPYLAQSGHPGAEYRQPEGQAEELDYGDQTSTRPLFQNFEGERAGESVPDHYKAHYNPAQPRMFNPEVPRQDGRFEPLQRQFLDAGQDSADHQQVAQLQILNKALSRQVEDLEQKLEDSKRKMRYLEHQFAIIKDEKEGLAVSLREAGHVMEEAREQEVQLQGKIKALELQVQAQADREHESVKKQRIAEVAVDSVKLQMAELCRSETLSRAREQHDRDLAALREQHESRTLALQQSLDSLKQALEEKTELCQRLQEQVKKVEREREEEKLERAGIINTLSQRLEESQTQCANLLQTGTAQEVSQLRIQLQQAQSLKCLNDSMNKSLQEELADLKEQITLYESGIKLGAVSLDSNGEWENELSDSYVQLGIKKANWRNGKLHRPLSAVVSDSSLPRDELVAELKAELQRFLASLKGKRKKISHLQEELDKAKSHAQDLRDQLERAEKSARDSKVRETSLEKHLETSGAGVAAQEDLAKLQKEKQHLQESIQTLDRQKEEMRRSEEKLKSDNLELCTKMREMIQEFDQEKQEAAERYERTQQQYRDDVVNHVREELTREHTAQLEELSAEFQLKIQHLESQLADGSKEMLAVQECYITVCREKDALEQDLHARMEEERKSMEEELKALMGEERSRALAELRAALEEEHRAALAASRAQWAQEQEAEVLQQVQSQLAQAKAVWQDQHSKASQAAMERVEKEWRRRLEEAQGRGGAARGGGAQDHASQTDTAVSLDARLASQRLRLQREADEARARAVEEAAKRTRQELQDTHLQELTQQVESAVSRARGCWLQEMTSLPEFKTHLQTQRREWEKQQEKDVVQQVSMALKEAEDSWQRTHLRKLEELEAEHHKEAESLRRQLEQLREEEQALLKVELARARTSWGREKQEEMSRLRAQNEQDYRSFLEQHRAQLEQALAQAREEADRHRAQLLLQKEAEFQRLLRARQEEWSAQQERRSRDEREQYREEALSEVRAALDALQNHLSEGPERKGQCGEGGSSASLPEGALWACVQAGCRNLLSKAVAQAKQEWKKSGQGKPGRVLKESQDQREKDPCQNPTPQPCSGVCAERVGRLQRHLEKACRQLQHTVRENKASAQRLKEEHEAAIRVMEQEHQRKLQEVRRSSGGCSPSNSPRGSDGQQCLQAGLEEMKDQYMRAVGKIRGDMLKYLQESKERAAQMIRQEVLRERRDTARKMRRYYLSCLQELLQDAGTSQGAEKKILSAASKLAAMTKVLETPLSKRREGKTRAGQSASKAKGATTEDKSQKSLISPSDLSQAGGRKDSEGNQKSPSADAKSETGPLKTTPMGEAPCQDSLKLMKWRVPEEDGFKAPPTHFLSRTPLGGAGRNTSVAVCTGDVTAANVTMRTHSRELSGGGLFQSKAYHAAEAASEPFLIKETPVRDEGSHSDWSAISMGAHFNHLFPNANRAQSFQLDAPSSASVSDTDEDDFRTIAVTAKPDFRGVPRGSSGSRSRPGPREPTPGSEGERLRRFCSKNLFSELKGCQQDSGFDSPLSLLHK